MALFKMFKACMISSEGFDRTACTLYEPRKILRTYQRYSKSPLVGPVRLRHRFGHELEPIHFRFTRSFSLQAHPKQHYHYYLQIIFRKTISWCQCTLIVRSYKAVPKMNRQWVFLQQGHYLTCWGIWHGVTKSRQVGP